MLIIEIHVLIQRSMQVPNYLIYSKNYDKSSEIIVRDCWANFITILLYRTRPRHIICSISYVYWHQYQISYAVNSLFMSAYCTSLFQLEKLFIWYRQWLHKKSNELNDIWKVNAIWAFPATNPSGDCIYSSRFT